MNAQGIILGHLRGLLATFQVVSVGVYCLCSGVVVISQCAN